MQSVHSSTNEYAASTHGASVRSPALRLPLARLLELIMILQTERFPNARRLAEICGVSRRTIYRDLSTLEAAGIQVIYSPDRQGYQLARECLLQPLQLDDYEAIALLLMSRCALADEPLGLAREARSGMAKVVGALHPQLRDQIIGCSELVREEPAASAIRDSQRHPTEQAILSALLHRRILRLRARDPKTGETFDTNLATYRLARIAGEWSLVGYSSHHGCVRIVDLRSIEKAELTDDSYSIPPRFRLERLSPDDQERKHLS
jgi:predicted DNA-binding transcriptional regulator YafY